MRKFFGKIDRSTLPDANPNVEAAINRLSIPQNDHQPQYSLHGDLTTPQDHMQVESYGVGPSLSIQVDSISVGGASTIQEHMQEDIGQALPKRGKKGWMTSNVSLGQDQDFIQVCDFLKDDNVGMVGIYGMGGVGKTTLLKKVCKEFLEPSHFKVIWIVVSKSIDVDNIQKNIMEQMNLYFNKEELRHKRAKKVNKALAKNKVGLLFDDIWQLLDMEEIGIIGDNDLDTSNFKIIFTTRSKKVCTQMVSDKEIMVECLGWDDSWAIFEKCVGKKTLEKSDPRVSLLAKEVVKECKGLPLALTVVGRGMTCKYTYQEWKDALNMLQKSRSDVLDPEKNLFNCLKLSYDYLPDHGEKNCFLYCCLFPEDYEMTSSYLVELWAVEGLLDMNVSLMEALNRGYGIIGTLRAACLLEKGSSDLKVKMHDVIRDMGLWITSELKLNYFVHGVSQMTNVEIIHRWREAHKFFVLDRDKLPEQPFCRNLTTLLISGESFKAKIPNGFFKSMRKLRVLQLSSVEFQDPLMAIGLLVDLRYLSLFQTNFLAEIGHLSKLEVLKYVNYHSTVTELPRNIGQLIELRKLVLDPCPKAFLAEIENMCNLEIMTIGGINDPYLNDVLESRLGRLPYSLRCVNLSGLDIDTWDDMLLALQDLSELSSLRVQLAHFREFSILSSSYFSNLEDLFIGFCSELEKVQLGQPSLQNLRVLHLIGCLFLKYIFGLEHLQGLAELTVYSCPMEELIKADGEMKGRICFPNLKVMNLVDLHNLKSICSDTVLFPSLTSFFLLQCNGLKKLPLGLMNGKLKACEIRGSREWWDGLLWEDDGFKTFIITTLCLELRPFWKIKYPSVLLDTPNSMEQFCHVTEIIIEGLKYELHDDDDDELYDEIPTTYHHKDCSCSHRSSPSLQLQI